MKAGVRVVCRQPAALGIALAGIAPIEAAAGAAAAAALAQIRDGIVLVEDSLYDALPTAALRKLRKAGVPILLPFPGPAGLPPGLAPEHELLEVLRLAVGYRVRLR